MADHDLLIVGAGPVGLSLALALNASGLAIAIADARPQAAIAGDPRALALAHGTRLTLERLGIWHTLPVTPIQRIHVSQQGSLGRTMMDAREHDLPALGYVVTAGDLSVALRSAVARAGVEFIDGCEVVAREAHFDHVRLSLRDAASGTESFRTARLVVCAEGGLRAGEDGVVEFDYDQHALISTANVQGDHRHCAFERFTDTGPLALLPHGERYAIVHVVPADRADALLALDDDAYLARLQSHLGSRVSLTKVDTRLRYPLGLRYRRKPIAPRTAWLGNAAQTLHPVAGQGFNLALRDVCSLAQRLQDNVPDPGDPALLAAYARSRWLDRVATIRFTDALVRLFSNDLPAPLKHARGGALLTLDAILPLRKLLARRMMFGARAWP